MSKKAKFWTPKLGESFKARLLCKQCKTSVVRPGLDGYCSPECKEGGEVRAALDERGGFDNLTMHHTAVKRGPHDYVHHVQVRGLPTPPAWKGKL